MQDDALDTIDLKPKPKAARIARDVSARKRRSIMKAIRETRLLNEFARLRRERKKNK